MPLDTGLQVVRNGDGALRVLDGDALVIEGRAAEVDLEPPARVSLEEARLATRRYRGVPTTCSATASSAARRARTPSWPLEADGRKRHAGAALLSSEGEALAVASALLVEPRAV